MINLADVVCDPDFAQPFTITRSNGQFVRGGFQNVTTIVQSFGIIQPATSKDLEQVPEGDRVLGSMLFHSINPIYTTRLVDGPGLSDQITWNGDQWRIQMVWPWQDFGFYRAIGFRMTGS